jgi:two-component system response regulator MprA
MTGPDHRADQPSNPRRTTGRVLVVDDDESLRRALTRALELEGYEIEIACDGLAALDRLDQAETPPDAIILDVSMPILDGIATCRVIRQTSRIPILMLTARARLDDRVEGLDAGADDYLAKPFALAELTARLRALLRRTGPDGTALVFDDLRLDPDGRRVERGGTPIELTRIEFSLLELFLHHPQRVLSRPDIFQQVWGYDMDFASNSLEVYVGYLRRKTEAGGGRRLIHTVRGVGYVLRDAP